MRYDDRLAIPRASQLSLEPCKVLLVELVRQYRIETRTRHQTRSTEVSNKPGELSRFCWGIPTAGPDDAVVVHANESCLYIAIIPAGEIRPQRRAENPHLANNQRVSRKYVHVGASGRRANVL